MPPKLGILAGGGELPARLIATCRATGRAFFVLAFEGHTEAGAIADAPHAWVRLGAAGKGLKLLKEAGVEELVLAGRFKRPTLSALRPDRRAVRLFTRLGRAAFGDDGLLSTVVAELEDEGFHVVGPDSIVADFLAPAGVYGRIAPDDQARLDIEHGVDVAAALGRLDVGHAVVVRQGVVLGVEAAEGTDALIRRCGGLEGSGGVLVKVKKPKQERRVDLPTIGVDTVKTAAQAGLYGIAVEAGESLVIDRAKVAEIADEAGLFVVGVAVSG